MSEPDWRDRTFLVTATTSATADRVANHLRQSIGGHDANWSAEEVPDGAAIVADPPGLWTLIERWYTVALQGHGKRATVESIALHGEIRHQIRAALGMEEQ